ncbi:peptidase S10 [Leptolyngbyaceae cyanobacterium CCMR0082]|uniref:Peptidase S10 n=1 Tax=Adonisia turfae CCMR0082 TaxID=2304604 RepID=A0A6M0SI44_9CYAN|nr:peptidase S10 [Adonisia turfae]NEZ68229.1 peptidase S10 [Adonisia turfae CCMR0082]
MIGVGERAEYSPAIALNLSITMSTQDHAAPDPKTTPEAGKSPEKKEKKRQLLGIEPVEKQHELALPDKTLEYTTHAGSIPLKDEFGETEAEIFFTAYTLTKASAPRPLIFVFNGGPGSSSVWLHLGAIGPQHVVMTPDGFQPPPPYRLQANASTWLDRADLVFIDPVGTGFSRAIDKDKDKKFWSFQGDIHSVGEFIRLYLTRYQRWTSPLYLAGESYGTTRAAGLASHLIDLGISFNGIVLISNAMDLRPVFFGRSDDLPFSLFVPTYTAAAWYHKKLAPELQQRSLTDILAEVETWSERELTLALMQGDRLLESDRQTIATTLAHYIGVDVDFVLGSNLRIDISRFCKELLRTEKRSIGRFDVRYTGIEALAVTERPDFDPAVYAIQPPFTTTFNDYVRRSLGIETDLNYEVISWAVNKAWQWENGELPTTAAALREAIAKNPFMKVFVAQGYYDLATPHLATDYTLAHMNLDPTLRDNIQVKCYEAGHMFYLDESCLAAFKADVDRFLAASWVQSEGSL